MGRPRPGTKLPLDTQKLGRFRRPGHRAAARRQRSSGAGWESVPACVANHARGARTLPYPEGRGGTATAFLAAAVRYSRRRGVPARRVLPDHRGCYRSRACHARGREFGSRHRCTKPCPPGANG